MKDFAKRSAVKINVLVLICFFLSGLTGLIYEILWTRMIVKIIGSAPFAVSIILTIFMAGLGIGSYIASRTIDRIKKPIHLVRLYGILELVIAVYVLLIPLLLTLFKPFFVILYNRFYDAFLLYNTLTFVGCSILLAVPVICMGATLPILCKFYVHALSDIGTNTSRLYGLNTIGAALGSFICGFWLLSLYGMNGTLYIAVAINVLISIVCISVSFKIEIPAVIAEQIDIKEQGDDGAKKRSLPAIVTFCALMIFAVSGFCSMAYEVIWAKLLGIIVGPTTYSFTIVLITFITGLALGCMIFGYFADKMKNPIALLIATQIAAAIFALLTSQLLGDSQLFFAKLLYSFQGNFAIQNMLKAFVVFMFMFLPTLCLGATFPLVSKIYTYSIDKIGKTIGFAYAINTIGAVLGSFCAGFLLAPFLGKEKALSLVVTFQLLCSLFVVLVVLARQKKTGFALFVIPAVIGLLLCFKLPSWNHHQLSTGKYHRFNEVEHEIKKTGWVDALLNGTEILTHRQKGDLVYYGDGIGGFVSVIESPKPLGGYIYSLTVSGKPDASSNNDMSTQTILAHFPMLFHPEPKDVMVLGLASGVTAGEVLNYPVDSLDVLDIDQQMVKASDFFREWNSDVLDSPKTNLIIQDGRAHLQLTEKKYDVIISEPSNPWMAGLAALFSKDFFELASERLNEGGIFVQWFHVYQMDWETFSIFGRTFNEVFPNSILVSTVPSTRGPDFLFIGFKDKSLVELENAAKNFQYAKRSKNVNLTDYRLFYKQIVAENLRDIFGQGPVHTDRTPILEFNAPKHMYRYDNKIQDKIRAKGTISNKTRDIIDSMDSGIDSQIDFAEYALSVNSPFNKMVDLSKASEQQKERFYKLVEDYSKRRIFDDQDIFVDEEIKQRCIKMRMQFISENIDVMPDKAISYRLLGDLHRESASPDLAIQSYYKSLEVRDNPESHCMLGVVFAEKGLADKAQSHFLNAIKLDPTLAPIYYDTFGTLLYDNKNFKDALILFQMYIKMKPNNPYVHNKLGISYARIGELERSIDHLTIAVQLKPDFHQARDNLMKIKLHKLKVDYNNQ